MTRRMKWITRLKHIIIFVYHGKKLSTEMLEITRLLDVLLKLWPCNDNIIISGKILPSVRFILIVISGISLYRISLYRGSLPYILQ